MGINKNQIFWEIIGCFSCFITIIILSTSLYFKFHYYLPYKYANLGNITWEVVQSNKTRDEMREDINKLVGITNNEYILEEKYLLDNNMTAGKAFLISRVIYIDPRLDDANYVMTLTHELVHIKYRSGDERFTQYTAWTLLYTSNNSYFINIALWQACVDNAGLVSRPYSITGHIEKYFK